MTLPRATPRDSRARVRGFTLVEMMVTLVLIAIIAMAATPSLTAFRRNSELRSTATAFMSALASARSEAMKRNVNVYVIPATGSDWSSGWTVFADTNWNQTYDTGTDTLLLSQGAIPSSTTVATTSQATQFLDTTKYVLFNGGGYPQRKSGAFAGGAIEFSTTGTSDARRRVVLTAVGRARLCDPVKDTSADCQQ